MTDDDLADVLAAVSPQDAATVAAGLRALVDAAGPLTGPDAALAARLLAAAEVLDPTPSP